MHPEPAAPDRKVEASPVFGRRAALLEEERAVDQFNVDPSVLHRFYGVGNLEDFASCSFGIGVGAIR